MNKNIINNDVASLERDEVISQSANNISENDILEKATLNFFPKEGSWSGRCFGQPEDLNMENLPCHLRDDLWLAEMLKQNQKLFYMSTSKIFQFVETSSLFQEKRHEYELEIVKYQIDWMKKGGEHWIIDEEYGGEFSLFTSKCDLAFRKGVADTLLCIGMSADAIEEGIERNADRWRDKLMNDAFSNEYNLSLMNVELRFYFDDKGMPKTKATILEPTDLDFKKEWLQMRKYEYYQRHKDSVDKYGVVEPDMLLSDEEVTTLRTYLEQKHKERKAQIKQYEQNRNDNMNLRLALKNENDN